MAAAGGARRVSIMVRDSELADEAETPIQVKSPPKPVPLHHISPNCCVEAEASMFHDRPKRMIVWWRNHSSVFCVQNTPAENRETLVTGEPKLAKRRIFPQKYIDHIWDHF